MKGIANKFSLAIITFMLVLVTFVTSAYAFLNIANFNLITGLEIGFYGGDQLEVSLDGVNYYESLTKEHFDQLNQNLTFVNVTTINNYDFNLGPKYFDEEAVAGEDYISFKLYFRSVNLREDYPFDHLYLANRTYPNYNDLMAKGTYAVSKGVTFRSPVEFRYRPNQVINQGDVNIFHASEAVRIGIRNEEQNINFIYDVSEDEEMGYGKEYGAFEYYNKVIGPNKLTLPTEEPQNVLYGLTEFDPGEPDIALDDRSLVAVLEEDGDYFKAEAIINIWLEGWDANSFDGIYRDWLKVHLEFVTARKRN